MLSQTLRLRLACLLLLVTFAVCAGAQTQALPGWTGQLVPGGLMLTSPASLSSPSLTLGLVMPTFIGEPADSWFANQTTVRSQAVGIPLAATGIMRNGQLLSRVVRIQGQGLIFRAVFYTYPAAGQQQMVILFIPEMVSDNDLRLHAATSYVTTLVARKVDLGMVLASVSSGPQYASPGNAGSLSPEDELARRNNQTRSLQTYSTNSAMSTIDLMHAMSH